MTVEQCATGSSLRDAMEAAMFERVRAEGAMIDPEPPFMERDKRFKRAVEVWFDSIDAFLKHRRTCTVCRQQIEA
jgi:hypothetical protein